MVNFVIFKAEQRNKRRSVFRLIVKYPLNFSAPLVSKCLLISTVYKCALVVLCGYLIPFLLSVFVLLRMKSLCCCWCRLLLSLCLIVVFLSLNSFFMFHQCCFLCTKKLQLTLIKSIIFLVQLKLFVILEETFCFLHVLYMTKLLPLT